MALQGIKRSIVTINSKDHAQLNILLKEEKDVAKDARAYAKQKAEAAKFMASWGKEQAADLEDITHNLHNVFTEFSKFFNDMSDHHVVFRAKLKEIRAREDALYDLRQKVKSAADKVKEAIKKQKPVDQLKGDLASLESQLATQEGEHEGFKRAAFQEGMRGQFDALLVFGKKVQVAATFGNHLADQIPQGSLAPGQKLPPYLGAEVTARIYADFLRELRELEPGAP
ncbi:Eisosome component PIL1/LSP1, partial [Blyttiomyces helicus]